MLGPMKQIESPSEVCTSVGSLCDPPAPSERLGIALGSLNLLPLNALRHPAQGGTCGWYIWGGEPSADPEFFQSLCVEHLAEHAPTLLPYLALAPGWRVLLAPGQTDIWYDPALLNA